MRWPDMQQRLGRIFKQKTRAEWTEIMEQTDICFAPVLRMSEAMQHPHNVHRESFVEVSASDNAAALVLDVRDDAIPGPGPAVAGLAVQVGALAGRLVVDHDGMGSRVQLDLPCGS